MMSQIAADLKQLQQYYFNKPIKEDAAKLLGGGFSFARNYRIEDSGKTYLARLMPANQALASREKECLITDYVGKIGIGAKVYYQNPQQGIMITEFIEGRDANFDDMVNEPNRSLIITNIKKLHQTARLDFPKAISLAVQIQNTLKRVASTTLQQQLETMELLVPLNCLFQYEEKNLTPAFIHGDLYPNNILIDKNRIYFIDWTDAGIGDPFVDISLHATFFPQSLHDNLLRYYFDHIDTIARQKLLCYYCLRLFKLAIWGMEQAKKISKDCEHLLIASIKQQNLPDPYQLAVDSFTNKLTSNNLTYFLLVTATMLHFLKQFTKTDTFLSAIEEPNHNA